MELGYYAVLPARGSDQCAAVVRSLSWPNPYCDRSTRHRNGVVSGVSLCDEHLTRALIEIADQIPSDRYLDQWFIDAAQVAVENRGGSLTWVHRDGEVEDQLVMDNLRSRLARAEELRCARYDAMKRELSQARQELTYMRSLERENEKLRARSGYKTYAITFGERFVKIGKSHEPHDRVRALRAGNFSKPPALKPETAQIVKIWDQDIERKLHIQLEAYRLRGEVFDLTAPAVREVIFADAP